ncbi:hypothetical protein WJX72_004640 [[Myrmecia] bisecta]|uniref:DM2 domain-containing protein n=1 Tax=[Myrmecia] bisecta TaxID=41462 RepID=A0AAW1R5W7_9CHLO
MYQQQQGTGQQIRLSGLNGQPAPLANLRGYSQGALAQNPQQLQQALAQNPQLQAQFAQSLQQQPAFHGMQAAQQMRPGTLYPQQRPTGLAVPATANSQAIANAAKIMRPGQAPAKAAPTSQAAAAGAVRAAEVAPAIRRQTTTTTTAAAAAAAAAANKKRKLPEQRPLPEKLPIYLPQSAMYTAALEQERRADSLLASKQAALVECIRSPQRIRKKLRVYTYHKHYHQPPHTSSTDPPSWEMLLYGKVLDPAEAASGVAAPPAPQAWNRPPVHPFTHYLRSLEVRRMDAAGSAPSVYSWQKANHDGKHHRETVSIRHSGSEDVQVQVTLEVDWDVEHFAVAEPLAGLIGRQVESRHAILQALWQHIKARGLQSAAQPERIDCDERLQAVFGVRTLLMNSLSSRITPFLSKAPPISWPYTIKVSGASPSVGYVHDIDIEVPDGFIDGKMAPFLDKLNKDGAIDQFDQKLGVLVHKINEHARRRDVYRAFSQSPVDVLNALIAEQQLEVRVMKEEGRQELQATRRTDFFQGKWVEDAVVRYLHRRLASGR